MNNVSKLNILCTHNVLTMNIVLLMVFDSLIKFRSIEMIFETAMIEGYSILNVDLPVNGLMLQIVVTTSHYYDIVFVH